MPAIAIAAARAAALAAVVDVAEAAVVAQAVAAVVAQAVAAAAVVVVTGIAVTGIAAQAGIAHARDGMHADMQLLVDEQQQYQQLLSTNQTLHVCMPAILGISLCHTMLVVQPLPTKRHALMPILPDGASATQSAYAWSQQTERGLML